MDKRTKEYKEMNNDKCVWTCVSCNRNFIGSKSNKPEICPACRNTGNIVFNTTLIVTK